VTCAACSRPLTSAMRYREHPAIPARIEGEIIVGKDVGFRLRLAHLRQSDGGNALHSEQHCSFHSPVPGEDLVVLADQNGVGEPEPLDAATDLLDLLLRMRGTSPGEGRKSPISASSIFN
jgi:hypothetical protein